MAGLHSQYTRKKGFTLIELVVVLIIIGILAVVLTPKFFERQSFDVREFADHTKSMLRYAQKHAIAQNRPVYVRLDLNRVALCYISTCDTVDTNNLVLSPGGDSHGGGAACGGNVLLTWFCLSTPSGISFSTGSPVINLFAFDAQGKPFAANDDVAASTSLFVNLDISIPNVDNTTSHVIVERETGYVH